MHSRDYLNLIFQAEGGKKVAKVVASWPRGSSLQNKLFNKGHNRKKKKKL